MSEAMEAAYNAKRDEAKETAFQYVRSKNVLGVFDENDCRTFSHEKIYKGGFDGGFNTGYQAAKAETCEWVFRGKHAALEAQYRTSCDVMYGRVIGTFCLNCGGRIVEKENQ